MTKSPKSKSQTVQSKTSSRGLCTITRVHTRGKYPLLPYEQIKNEILGKEYNLNIAFVDEKTSTKLHLEWKKSPGPANILSFPYSKKDGEIILHLPTVYTKAIDYNHSPKKHLLYLIIHGCLHLKGYVHSNAMDKQEIEFLKRFQYLI